MVEYPYGRQGTAVVFYQDRIDESAFDAVTEDFDGEMQNDNEVKRKGGKVYVYEAPMQDDPGRGHFSIWEPADTGTGFIQVEGISGDDGMIFEKFQNA